MTRKLYVKSYGCQMNVYDSQSYGGPLAPEGYVETADAGRRRPDHPQHLPHPREGRREGLFGARPHARAEGGGRAAGTPRHRSRSPAASRRPRARRSSAARRRSISWSGRRAITACRRCWRAPTQRHGIVETEFPVEDKFDHLAAPSRAAIRKPRRVGFRHRAGRLRQVLHLLRRALYARRGSVAAGREDRRRSGAPRRRRRARDHADRPERQRLSRRGCRRPRLRRSDACCTALADIPGIARLRYTTSHPGDMDDEPDRRASRSAGADAATASAGAVRLRPHPRGDEPPPHRAPIICATIERLRAARPDLAFTSDFIVGFPGETEDDFADTHAARRRGRLRQRLLVQIFAAARHARRRHGDQVAEAVKTERLQRLQDAIDRARRRRSTRAASGTTFDVLFEKPGRLPARSSAARHICSRCRSWRRASLIGDDRAGDHHRSSEPTACSARSRTTPTPAPPARPSLADAWSLMHCALDRRQRIWLPAAEADEPRPQVVLTFDDNRRASMLFGQYGQNLALIERRLGVVAEQRGNQVTIEGSRDACEQARRVLEGLYEQHQARPRSRLGRCRRRDPPRHRAGLAVRLRPARRRGRPSRRSICASARCVPAPPRRTPTSARSTPRAGVRHRPRRHRQDLARGRACGVAVRAQGSRPHHPVAPGGRGRRAARLPARRHAREGRSVSAPDATTRSAT